MSGDATTALAPKVGVFHPGTQHSWQTARALAEIDRLAWYATSIYYQPDRWPYRLERIPGALGRRLGREFRRFQATGLDPALVHSFGLYEWLERIAFRAGFIRLATALDKAGNRAFGRGLERQIASDDPFMLWGYNNSSLSAFRLGKRHGRTCILDRTIGDPRAYNRDMLALQERYGDWFLQRGVQEDDDVIANAAQEHALADRILVGCPFAAQTIAEFDADAAEKVEVLEYCFDAEFFRDIPPPRPVDLQRPVRFLFLGLAIPRKGIHHVLEAIERLPASEASLTVVGNLGVPASVWARYRDRVSHVPTVPRAAVPQIMAEHDVLLFPSYFEGAGIVLYEALASGLALIQSDRAALAVTPDTGVLLARPDSELLVEAMRRPIEDRDLLDHWRGQAQAEAAKYRFSGYRDRIAGLLDRLG